MFTDFTFMFFTFEMFTDFVFFFFFSFQKQSNSDSDSSNRNGYNIGFLKKKLRRKDDNDLLKYLALVSV